MSLLQIEEIDEETRRSYSYVLQEDKRASYLQCLKEVMGMNDCRYHQTSAEHFNRYKNREWFITKKDRHISIIVIDYPDCCPSDPYRREAVISEGQLISASKFSVDELAKFPVENAIEFVANLVYPEVKKALTDSERYYQLNWVSLGHALWKVPTYLVGYEKIKSLCEQKAREEFVIDEVPQKRVRQVRDALNKCQDSERIEKCAQILGI